MSTDAAIGLVPLTDEQLTKERAVRLGIVTDVAFITVMVTVSVLGQSFTLLADSVRAITAVFLECFTYAVLRRIHRGVLADLDYGTGKLEQIANLVIGAGMLAGSAWMLSGAARILMGERALGSPLGLTVAAITGLVNVYLNLILWDNVRRAAAGGDSLIMQSQLVLRRTKLLASLVVAVGLTVAAQSTDDLVVAWADALGAIFVGIYTATNGFQILRQAIPDLLDRTAGPRILQAVSEALAEHTGAYTRVRRIRTRRSGHTAFVEIDLEFDPGLTIAEIDRRVTAVKTTIFRHTDHVDVAIQPSQSF